MNTARHSGHQRLAGVCENPVRSFSTGVQDMEQHEHNRHITHAQRYFECQNRFVNRGYRSKEELSARRIWARHIRVVQRARFARMQRAERRVAGNEAIGAVAEPLHAAVPQISMNVIIWTRWQPQEQTMPYCRQHERGEDHALGEYWREEELTNGQQVREAGNGQWNDEGRCTRAPELA